MDRQAKIVQSIYDLNAATELDRPLVYRKGNPDKYTIYNKTSSPSVLANIETPQTPLSPCPSDDSQFTDQDYDDLLLYYGQMKVFSIPDTRSDVDEFLLSHSFLSRILHHYKIDGPRIIHVATVEAALSRLRTLDLVILHAHSKLRKHISDGKIVDDLYDHSLEYTVEMEERSKAAIHKFHSILYRSKK